MRNIYSNRVMRAPHRLGSTASSPAPSQKLTSLRPRKKSDPQLTPRQKVNLFERKRRDEDKRLREVGIKGCGWGVSTSIQCRDVLKLI